MDAIYVKTDNSKGSKATILFRGGMGNIVSKHVSLLDHGRMPYAQHKSAVFVKYVEKGKRKAKGFVLTYAPYLVILDGWQDIETQDMFNAPVKNADGTIIQTGKYMSCSDEWRADFELDHKFNHIIADYRDVNTMEI